MVLCADDPEILDKLDWAAETGQSLEAYKSCQFVISYVLSTLTISPWRSVIQV